jgi:hypothetical protein
MSMMAPNVVRERLAALRTRLGGRAAGAWKVEGNRLEQVAFDSAPDMPAEVAQGFASATRTVDLARLDLGIVKAAESREVVVSVDRELPAEIGSGYWLRAFGAPRSVAVPILDRTGRTAFVVSLALGPELDDEAVASAIRGESWTI